MLRARGIEVKAFLVHSRVDSGIFRSRWNAQGVHSMPKNDKPQGMAGKRGAAPVVAAVAAKKTAKKAVKKTAKKAVKKTAKKAAKKAAKKR